MFSRHLRSTLFPYTTLFRSVAASFLLKSVLLQHCFVHLVVLIGRYVVYIKLVVLNNLPDNVIQETVHKERDRKSTRLNSSHQIISYAVFCLKKKKNKKKNIN